MIYVNLLIDYIVCNICNFNSYLVLIELDKRKLVDVIICGLLMDIMFSNILLNTIVILVIYWLFRRLNIKNKYVILKNILIYVLYVFIRHLIHIFI